MSSKQNVLILLLETCLHSPNRLSVINYIFLNNNFIVFLPNRTFLLGVHPAAQGTVEVLGKVVVVGKWPDDPELAW